MRTCDKCKKEIEKRDIFDDFNFNIELKIPCDLCNECKTELDSELNKRIREFIQG